jgi:16S rRNA G966 N2-methylase RsmD
LFYYYGRRKQIAHQYPQPQHTHIVEPFAGSAAYSLYWAEKGIDLEVTLIDKSEVVATIWNYLISAKESDIKNLPATLKTGDNLNDYRLSIAERFLIGFHINPGSAVPKLTVSKASRWEAGRKYILKTLPLVRHWKFIHGEYYAAEASIATWFIDPPFQCGGTHYQHQIHNYDVLGDWVKSRCGQVIVCEAEPATWLPFKDLGSVVNNGGLNLAKRRKDLIWTNCMETHT